jgi:hypothetical protein
MYIPGLLDKRGRTAADRAGARASTIILEIRAAIELYVPSDELGTARWIGYATRKLHCRARKIDCAGETERRPSRKILRVGHGRPPIAEENDALRCACGRCN